MSDQRTEQNLLAYISALEAELLRVRTTAHGAAHELDNIAVELGLGHSPKPTVVAEEVRKMRERIATLESTMGTLRQWTRDTDRAARLQIGGGMRIEAARQVREILKEAEAGGASSPPGSSIPPPPEPPANAIRRTGWGGWT